LGQQTPVFKQKVKMVSHQKSETDGGILEDLILVFKLKVKMVLLENKVFKENKVLKVMVFM
jgi:hypothetical protein